MTPLKALRFSPPGRTGPVSHEPRIDGLRGFAAVSVMMVHGFWFQAGPSEAPLFRPSEYILNLHMARVAVLLFFIASGYVIGLTNQQPFSGVLAREYLRRRVLRIVPIYLLAIFAGWIAYRNVALRTVFENMLFLQNPAWRIQVIPGDIPLWSLHNEVVYYLAFIVLWRLQPRVLPFVAALLVLATADWFVGGPLSVLGGWSVGGLFWLAGLLLAWKRPRRESLGTASIMTYVLLAFATNHLWPGVVLLNGLGFHYAGTATLWFADLALLPVSVVLFCAVMDLDFPGLKWARYAAMLIPLATTLLLLGMGRLWGNVPWTLAAIATTAAVALASFDQRRWGELFFALFRPLGKISYGLYVFHVPCVLLVGAWYPWTGGWVNYFSGFLLWVSITILIAWICEARMQPAILSYYKRRMATVSGPLR